MTAENLHDRFPAITKERADAYALASQHKVAAAYAAGKIQPDLVPMAIRTEELGWGWATADEPPRPDTTLEGLAALKTPFRPHGRVTAGNSAGINDGATGCVIAAEEVAAELGLTAKMRLVDFQFAGVEPEVMGIGPVPATEKLLARNGLTMDDIGLIEINEAFAVQVLAFLDHFKIDDDDPRVNPWGGAIAIGHPLASSGVRLMIQLAAAARRAARGPLRPHDHVRRHGHGRHRAVGEDLDDMNMRPNATGSRGGSRPLPPGDFPDEVVTRAIVRDVDLGPGARHAGADHAGQRARPHQAEHVRPARPAVAERRARRGRRAGGGGRDRRRRRDRQAVHPRRRRRPGRRGRGDHRRGADPAEARERALGDRAARARGVPAARRAARPVVRLHQRRGARRRP